MATTSFDRMSDDDDKIAQRVAKLAQITEQAYNTNFKVVIYDRTNPMTVKPEVLDASVRVFEKATIFEELLRADLRNGKLAQLLAKGAGN